jgi:hypothetical protein
MPGLTSSPVLLPGALSSLLLAIWSLPALGQASPQDPGRVQFGAGYVANAPKAMAGVSGYVLFPRLGGVGLYLDAKTDVTGPSRDRGYDASVTAGQIQAGPYWKDLIKSEGSWRSFNVAVLYAASPSLLLYGGGGMARQTVFRLFQVDRASGLGQGGIVWAQDPGAEETRVNFMAGTVMRLTGLVSSHFGFETQPRGLTVGASLRLPPW